MIGLLSWLYFLLMRILSTLVMKIVIKCMSDKNQMLPSVYHERHTLGSSVSCSPTGRFCGVCMLLSRNRERPTQRPLTCHPLFEMGILGMQRREILFC